MSKKTMNILLVAVLIIAAAVAIYYATRQPAEPASTAAPSAEIVTTQEAPADTTPEATAEPTAAPAGALPAANRA